MLFAAALIIGNPPIRLQPTGISGLPPRLARKAHGKICGHPSHGKTEPLPGISTFRIEGGLLIDAWELIDNGDLLQLNEGVNATEIRGSIR